MSNHKLTIKPLPASDSGRQLVRVHRKYRSGVPRYGLGKLTDAASNKSVTVLFLGHDDEDAIYIPFDIRYDLGVQKNDFLEFKIGKIGWIKKLWWYLNTKDPAVYIPAWIAVFSVVLGILSLVISLDIPVCAITGLIFNSE